MPSPMAPGFRVIYPDLSQHLKGGFLSTMYTQDIVGGYRRYIQLYMISVLPKKK